MTVLGVAELPDPDGILLPVVGVVVGRTGGVATIGKVVAAVGVAVVVTFIAVVTLVVTMAGADFFP